MLLSSSLDKTRQRVKGGGQIQDSLKMNTDTNNVPQGGRLKSLQETKISLSHKEKKFFGCVLSVSGFT
jgi:hypothetical protein